VEPINYYNKSFALNWRCVMGYILSTFPPRRIPHLLNLGIRCNKFLYFRAAFACPQKFLPLYGIILFYIRFMMNQSSRPITQCKGTPFGKMMFLKMPFNTVCISTIRLSTCKGVQNVISIKRSR
jgi:hypothetical protein